VVAVQCRVSHCPRRDPDQLKHFRWRLGVRRVYMSDPRSCCVLVCSTSHRLGQLLHSRRPAIRSCPKNQHDRPMFSRVTPSDCFRRLSAETTHRAGCQLAPGTELLV
jgi:hypothetical protein